MGFARQIYLALALLGFVSLFGIPLHATKKSDRSKSAGSTLGFEAKLWLAADKLRNNMDAAEYKHVVLGLIFLKYISDAFEEHHAKLVEGKGEYNGSNPEDPDEYVAENIFWVPPAAQWTYLQNNAKQPEIGKIVDEAMIAIECDDSRLMGVFSKECARPALDAPRLGELGLPQTMHEALTRTGFIPGLRVETADIRTEDVRVPIARNEHECP